MNTTTQDTTVLSERQHLQHRRTAVGISRWDQQRLGSVSCCSLVLLTVLGHSSQRGRSGGVWLGVSPYSSGEALGSF